MRSLEQKNGQVIPANVQQKQTKMLKRHPFVSSVAFCKSILDEIETPLAGRYGFTKEDLSVNLHYDIKYRLGRSTGEEGEG